MDCVAETSLMSLGSHVSCVAPPGTSMPRFLSRMIQMVVFPSLVDLDRVSGLPTAGLGVALSGQGILLTNPLH